VPLTTTPLSEPAWRSYAVSEKRRNASESEVQLDAKARLVRNSHWAQQETSAGPGPVRQSGPIGG